MFRLWVYRYRLITSYLGRQKELDAYPKAIEDIELFGQLKSSDNAVVTNESMSIFKLL